jgi:uncharacterized protein YbjT (DUF2867 family)
MTVLITTPNGKVGSEVARILLEAGVPVRIGAHTPAKAEAAFPGAEIVHFDYGDENSVKAALQDVTALYFAAPSMTPASQQIRMLELAKAANVRRVVRLSAMGVEHSDNPLRQVEQAIEQTDLEWTILRPTWFMQNFSTTSAQAIRSGVLAEPSGDGKTAFIDARDIAAVAAKALTEDGHHGQIYVLTGPRNLSRYEVADILSQASGRSVQYIPITDEQFRDTMKAFMPEDYIDLLVGLHGMVRAGWTEVTTDAVQKVTGRAPISLEQFAEDYRQVWAEPAVV